MTDSTPSRWSHPYPVAGFFFALFVLLCLLRLPLADRPIRDVDESVAAIIATSWLEGGVPYRDAIDQRGPVTYVIYAAAFLVGGKNSMTAVHWALLLLIWAGCWLLYRLAPELGARDGEADLPAGYLAAALFAVTNFTYRPTQMLAFHTEWPVVIFSTLGMGLLWRALVRQQGAGRLFLAGLAFGAAFLSKQPAVFDGLASGLFLLAWQWRQGRFLTAETVRRAGALAGGFVTLVVLNLAYFAAHGALGDFYLYFWSYNVEHYTAVVPVVERLRGLNPFHFNRHLLTANPLLFAAAVAGVVRLVVVFVRRGREVVDAKTLLTLWLALAYFGASYSGRNFGHYFIQILCPACLLAALYLAALWRGAWLGASRFGNPLILRGLLVAATVVALAVPLYRFRDHIAVVEMQRPASPKVAQDALVAWVIRETAPSDTIFVWGYNPEVYLLSNRRPATRYSNTNYLTGMLPWENHQPGVDTREHIVPEAMDILLRELAENKPQLIIDTVPGNHRFYRKYPLEAFPRLAVFLRAGFQKVETIRDEDGRAYYEVWRRRG